MAKEKHYEEELEDEDEKYLNAREKEANRIYPTFRNFHEKQKVKSIIKKMKGGI